MRRCVKAKNALLKNWKGFLQCSQIKTELFDYLAKEVVCMDVPTNKVIKVTYGDKVICKPEWVDCSAVSPCSHEEADTRMLFHVAEAAVQGCDTAIYNTHCRYRRSRHQYISPP